VEFPTQGGSHPGGPAGGPASRHFASLRRREADSPPAEALAGYKWVFIDAAGTLIRPAEDVAAAYQRFAGRHGIHRTRREILRRYRSAYQRPWEGSIRFRGDARDFWVSLAPPARACASLPRPPHATHPRRARRRGDPQPRPQREVVFDTLESRDEACFEEIYAYYGTAQAWRLAPGARESLVRLREAGIGVVCLSNFDTRLTELLYDLGVGRYFDHFIVSGEVGYEKPSLQIFEAALHACGAAPGECLHVGDDRRNDIWGARDAGVRAWQFGYDIKSFAQLADLLVARAEP